MPARTGLFMAHYLKMQHELPTLDAIAAVKAVRPIALSADGWDQFAIEVLDACAGLIRQGEMSKGDTQN
jgi:protein-tyrosine phosphatase